MFEIPLEIDYSQKITVYMYNQWLDIIESLGGISAATDPIFMMITPLIFLYFFYEISRII